MQEMTDRKRSPDYKAVAVYLPRELLVKVKALAGYRELTLSEAGEEALREWVDQHWSQMTKE
jgi:hypothetical protein